MLFALAELAVAFAGFSAIVVLFKRRDSGKWLPGDADRFHGMVLHAMAAVFFCALPAIVGVFTTSPDWIWGLASGLLGLQIAAHVILVLSFSTTTGFGRIALGFGLLVAGLQALNVLEVGFSREFGPYLLGVLWHLFQSGVLFVWLIWIPADAVETE